jgi:hypothetical protein
LKYGKQQKKFALILFIPTPFFSLIAGERFPYALRLLLKLPSDSNKKRLLNHLDKNHTKSIKAV